MTRDGLVRATLWLSFPFNLFAAAIFAFPSTAIGAALGLPADPGAVYRMLCAFLIALFGFMYAWLARQPDPNQPLLFVGAAGKAGVFAVAAMLGLAGAASGLLVVLASGDLALASIWFWSLAAAREDAA